VDLISLRDFLVRLQRGELTIDEALRTLSRLPVQRVGEFAQLDGERAIRQGVPEVVFGERKTPDQIGKLVARLRELGQAVLVTRLSPEGGEAAGRAAPEGRYDPISRTFHA
jgi:NCAIR mutase (PurE)-related protein